MFRWYYIIMLRRIVAFVTICSVVGVLAVMQSSTPSSSNPLAILLVFLLLYGLALGVLIFLLYGAKCIISRFYHTNEDKMEDRQAWFARSFRYGSVLALAPIIMLAVQSIGGLSVYEVVLIIVFEAVVLFYLYRQR